MVFFVVVLHRSVWGLDCGKTIVGEGESTGNRQKIKGLHREKGEYLQETGCISLSGVFCHN